MLQSVKCYGEVKSNNTDTDQDYLFPGRGGESILSMWHLIKDLNNLKHTHDGIYGDSTAGQGAATLGIPRTQTHLRSSLVWALTVSSHSKTEARGATLWTGRV